MVDTGLEFLCIHRVLHASHSFLVLSPEVGFIISHLAEEEGGAQRGKAKYPWTVARKWWQN